MIDDNLIEDIVAEIGALVFENDRFRKEITTIRTEVELLKERSTNADVSLETLMKDAVKLRASLSELRSNAAQLRANAAQLRADKVQASADEKQQVADQALENQGTSQGARDAQVEASETQDWANQQQDIADKAQRRTDDSY
jgi:chromosome segregation ATPase